VDDDVDAVPPHELVEEGGREVVGDAGDDLVHPLDALDHLEPLALVHEWRPLAAPDLRVGDEAYDELVPEGLGLAERVCVAVVHQVEAAVHVDADRATACDEVGGGRVVVEAI
jgi:hypothetical protein